MISINIVAPMVEDKSLFEQMTAPENHDMLLYLVLTAKRRVTITDDGRLVELCDACSISRESKSVVLTLYIDDLNVGRHDRAHLMNFFDHWYCGRNYLRSYKIKGGFKTVVKALDSKQYQDVSTKMLYLGGLESVRLVGAPICTRSEVSESFETMLFNKIALSTPIRLFTVDVTGEELLITTTYVTKLFSKMVSYYFENDCKSVEYSVVLPNTGESFNVYINDDLDITVFTVNVVKLLQNAGVTDATAKILFKVKDIDGYIVEVTRDIELIPEILEQNGIMKYNAYFEQEELLDAYNKYEKCIVIEESLNQGKIVEEIVSAKCNKINRIYLLDEFADVVSFITTGSDVPAFIDEVFTDDVKRVHCVYSYARSVMYISRSNYGKMYDKSEAYLIAKTVLSK